MRSPNILKTVRTGNGTLPRKRSLVSADSPSSTMPPRASPRLGCALTNADPCARNFLHSLGLRYSAISGTTFVFLVVEVFVDATRESLDHGQEFLGTPRVTRLGPRDRGGPNSLAGIIDGAVRILHPGQLGGSARRPGGQPRPHNPVLGRMMKMHRRHHEVDVLANHCGASAVTGSDTAHEASSIVQLPAEATVNQRHLERITRHLYPHCSVPKLQLSSVSAQLRRG